jgi:hypothetical protein
MSQALTRLRHMLKDDLFIRSPKGMVPTPRAEQLALPVRSAIDGLQHSLEPTQFIPSKAARSFRVAADNYSAIVLVGPLAGWVTKYQFVCGHERQSGWLTSARNVDLLPKREDFCFQRRPRSKQIDDETEYQSKETHHPAQRRPILHDMPTGFNLRRGQGQLFVGSAIESREHFRFVRGLANSWAT